MDKGKPDTLEALIARTRAHQAEFAARNPGFLADEETKLREATAVPPPTTAKASTLLSKKKVEKQRDFDTFIERSLPPEAR